MINIYLVERTDDVDYDQYDSFICVADSEETARWTTPDPEYHLWIDKKWHFNYSTGPKEEDTKYSGWTKDPTTLKITELGVPKDPTQRVILGSFNAG